MGRARKARPALRHPLFPYRQDHALLAFEPLLRFVNTEVTDSNYAQLVTPGSCIPQSDALLLAAMGGTKLGGAAKRPSNVGRNPPRTVLMLFDMNPRTVTPIQGSGGFERIALDLSGGASPFGDFYRSTPGGVIGFRKEALGWRSSASLMLGAVHQLQRAMRRALERYFERADDPLLDVDTGKVDFTVKGRRPFQDARGEVDSEGKDTVRSDDLQDYWYRMMRLLFTMLRKRENLIHREGRARVMLPFRPLARCEAPRCSKFFFRIRAGDRTCGDRKCARALYYHKHKGARPAGRPRSRVPLPHPRAKRRPA